MMTRRKVMKAIATGGAVAAASGALAAPGADSGVLLGSVSRETSDGKTRYGKCLVPLPIRKMGEMSMFAAGAELLNGFPCNIIYAFGLEAGPLGLSREPHVHDHDEVVYFIGSDPAQHHCCAPAKAASWCHGFGLCSAFAGAQACCDWHDR